MFSRIRIILYLNFTKSIHSVNFSYRLVLFRFVCRNVLASLPNLGPVWHILISVCLLNKNLHYVPPTTVVPSTTLPIINETRLSLCNHSLMHVTGKCTVLPTPLQAKWSSSAYYRVCRYYEKMRRESYIKTRNPWSKKCVRSSNLAF